MLWCEKSQAALYADSDLVVNFIDNITKYKKYSAIYTSLCRASKKQYYNNKFKQFSGDGKKTWQTINQILGRTLEKSSIPNTFISNEKILPGELEIAEGFNDFFSNIGPKLAEQIPPSGSSFSDYLKDEIIHSFTFPKVTPEVLNTALNKLKNKNSSGPDHISTNLLKYISDSITIPLCHLYNISFRSGIVPDSLKTAKCIPIFKTGNNQDFSNYRPISLLRSLQNCRKKL